MFSYNVVYNVINKNVTMLNKRSFLSSDLLKM